MDQLKTGKFIAAKRKEQKLTQMQLAEKLGITDRAVSKWETGRSLPDASIMLDLCEQLQITVNDLLSGEVVSMENINENTQRNLIEMVRQKEQADKRLLSLEYFIAGISVVFLVTMISVASHLDMKESIKAVLICIGIIQFIIATLYALRIEQVAGYYECAKCGHKYVPSYVSVNMSMHMGRTRYMKCPHCGKRSWQKKVISKD